MLNRRTKFWFKRGVLIMGIILLVGVGVLGMRTYRFFRNIGVAVSKKITPPKTTYTTALLGYGGGGHEGGMLTDTLVIAHLNFETKKALLISIPRDLWVSLPTKSKEPFAAKINTVYQLQLYPATFPDVAVNKYTKNDPNGLMKKILADISGLSIDSYAAVNFAAFQTIINTLGGIDVEVSKSFTDTEYPIEGKETDLCGKEEKDLPELEKIATESPVLAFPCRYETVSFSAGLNHLNGEQALKFARSRHSLEDGGDFARASRQQKVIEAVTKKLLTPTFLTKIPTLMDQLESKVQTDASYTDLSKLLKEAPNAENYTLKKLILSDDNFLKSAYSQDGQYILVPKKGFFKWATIKNKIRNLTAPLPTPTPEIKKD